MTSSALPVDIDAALGCARRIARQAGSLLVRRHPAKQAVAYKGDVDLVTESDRQSEALIVSALGKTFPEHAVIAEEGTRLGDSSSDAIWYVDPLDGTTNYAHGHPWYSVSISLVVDGAAIVGVVYAPELQWEFWTARGRGAWLGEQSIKVSATPRLDNALVATGFPYDRRTAADNNVSQLAAVLARAQGVRRFGSAALDCAAVAWGIIDGYWEYKLKPWDICAGALLVAEAGGTVSLIDDGPFEPTNGQILATNGQFHDDIAAVLRSATLKSRS